MPSYFRSADEVKDIIDRMKKSPKHQLYDYEGKQWTTPDEEYLVNALLRDICFARRILGNGPTLFKTIYTPGYYCNELCQIAQVFEEKGMAFIKEAKWRLRVMYKELLDVLTNDMNYRTVNEKEVKDSRRVRVKKRKE